MTIFIVDMPSLAGLEKVGVDDFLVHPDGGPEKMISLIQTAPRHKPPSAEELIEESGIKEWVQQPDSDTEATAFRFIAEQLRGAAPLTRIAVRERLIQRLKELHYKAPAMMADAALGSALANESTAASDVQGSAVIFEDVIPCDQPVDGATLLGELIEFLSTYLVLPASMILAMALWTLHTYVLGATDVTPYLLSQVL
jgi:hypothetical protein